MKNMTSTRDYDAQRISDLRAVATATEKRDGVESVTARRALDKACENFEASL